MVSSVEGAALGGRPCPHCWTYNDSRSIAATVGLHALDRLRLSGHASSASCSDAHERRADDRAHGGANNVEPCRCLTSPCSHVLFGGGDDDILSSGTSIVTLLAEPLRLGGERLFVDIEELARPESPVLGLAGADARRQRMAAGTWMLDLRRGFFIDLSTLAGADARRPRSCAKGCAFESRLVKLRVPTGPFTPKLILRVLRLADRSASIMIVGLRTINFVLVSIRCTPTRPSARYRSLCLIVFAPICCAVSLMLIGR